jgi:ligand-binding sensor domain-containing protein
LKLYDPKDDVFYGYYYSEKEPFSIKHGVAGIMQDKQHNYWTWHANNGVGLRLFPKGFDFYNADTYRFWHTSFNTISAIANDKQGKLWFGSHSGGINIFNWEKGVVEYYTSNSNDPTAWGQDPYIVFTFQMMGKCGWGRTKAVYNFLTVSK